MPTVAKTNASGTARPTRPTVPCGLMFAAIDGAIRAIEMPTASQSERLPRRRLRASPFEPSVTCAMGPLPDRGSAADYRTTNGSRVHEQVGCPCDGVLPRAHRRHRAERPGRRRPLRPPRARSRGLRDQPLRPAPEPGGQGARRDGERPGGGLGRDPRERPLARGRRRGARPRGLVHPLRRRQHPLPGCRPGGHVVHLDRQPAGGVYAPRTLLGPGLGGRAAAVERRRERRERDQERDRPHERRGHRVLHRPGADRGGRVRVAEEFPGGGRDRADRVPVGDRAQHLRHPLRRDKGVRDEREREQDHEPRALGRFRPPAQDAQAGARPGHGVAEEQEDPEPGERREQAVVGPPADRKAGERDDHGAEDDGRPHRRRRQIERQQAGDGVVGVAAAVREHDARAEHVHEERGEEDGLDGHVGELERLTGDVDEVAPGEDGDVAQAAHEWITSRAAPGEAAAAASTAWPVRAKKTSSREGWCTWTSSTVTPAPSRARTTWVARPAPVRTGARRRRPSWLACTAPSANAASAPAADGSGSVSVTSRRAPPVWAFSSPAVPLAIPRPWSTTTIRSASSSASSRYWVVSRSVAPSPASSRITPHIRTRLVGSRPVVGSSRKSTGGRVTRPAARSSRRRMPPEYSRRIRSAASTRSNWRRSSAARARASPRRRPLKRPIITRFCRPVSTSSRVASWAVTPIWRWTARASRTTSCPATRAEPASGRVSVVRMRTAVVLPAPFGPSTPRMAPRGTSRSSPASATVGPNRFRRPSASIINSFIETPYRSASNQSSPSVATY